MATAQVSGGVSINHIKRTEYGKDCDELRQSG